MSASQHRSNGKLPATEALADFVLGGRVDDHTLRLATSAVLDTVAVTIAGSGEPGPSRLQKALEPVHGPLSSRLLWSAASFNRFDAALITGTASHVLDYDDVSMLSVCHPSAPVLSALLNLRSWDNLDGRELIEAFVIGTEVLIRLGQAMGFRHYALGFHATATLGAVAAAAACARLLRLYLFRPGTRWQSRPACRPVCRSISARWSSRCMSASPPATGCGLCNWPPPGSRAPTKCFREVDSSARFPVTKVLSGRTRSVWGRPLCSMSPASNRSDIPAATCCTG